MRLSTVFHLQISEQIEYMNQELEQYLQFFVDHRQRNQLEWLVTVEFVVNNKVYMTTKISLFIANYKQKLRMEANIRRKRKIEKAIEFAERMKKVQKEAGIALKKVQKKMKQQADKKRMEAEEWKKRVKYERFGV